MRTLFERRFQKRIIFGVQQNRIMHSRILRNECRKTITSHFILKRSSNSKRTRDQIEIVQVRAQNMPSIRRASLPVELRRAHRAQAKEKRRLTGWRADERRRAATKAYVPLRFRYWLPARPTHLLLYTVRYVCYIVYTRIYAVCALFDFEK